MTFTPADMIELHDPANGQVGDCFRAVIATLVGVPAGEVPHFVKLGDAEGDTDASGSRWWDLTLDWLYARHLWIENLPVDPVPQRPHLASGPGPRGLQHCVAVDTDGTVHDPHPSRAGLLSVNWRAVIVPFVPDEEELYD